MFPFAFSFCHAVCLLFFSNLGFGCLQGVLMMKGLMDHCVSQATVVDHVRVRVEATEVELGELKA